MGKSIAPNIIYCIVHADSTSSLIFKCLSAIIGVALAKAAAGSEKELVFEIKISHTKVPANMQRKMDDWMTGGRRLCELITGQT